jgi:acyl carrier protein
MDRKDLLLQVTNILIEVFENKNLTIDEATQATDVEEWDSLTHIMLIVAIEKHFKIRFSSREIQGWVNVGEMLNSIAVKIVS